MNRRPGPVRRVPKRTPQQPKKRASKPQSPPAQPAASEPLPPLRLGFVRGVSPSKWAERWARAATGQPLELVPVGLQELEVARAELDMLLERVPPSARPQGVDADPNRAGSEPTRHAVRLYEEGVALVVPAGHELAKQHEVGLDDLSLVTLLAHSDHQPEWPRPEPWAEPSWAPADAEAALDLVATGLGAALLSFPLARHLAGKRTHSVVPVSLDGEALLPGTEIWASWATQRDGADVQRLVGVMRGRTSRSSR